MSESTDAVAACGEVLPAPETGGATVEAVSGEAVAATVIGGATAEVAAASGEWDAIPADPMREWPTGRLLSMAARLVEHAWTDALDELGLTHAGLVALHLLDAGPLSQTDLARRARVQTQTMSRTLERLEREGYVERLRSRDDARRHVVTRTPTGRDAWSKAQTLEADLFPPLEDPGGMRTALLDIIAASSANRW